MALLVYTALALYEMRAANPAEAIRWVHQALQQTGQTHSIGADYQIFLRSILVMACRRTGDIERSEAEARSVREFVQMHGKAFETPGAPDGTYFVPVIERALAMILAREALGLE